MRADLRSRLLMTLAALVLLPAFVLPLWSIGLVAPQYPDGLGMHIYVHDVRGHERHDLQNINILNHYIGMQPIEPENIPELRIMPWVLAGLVVSGLGVAALGRPRVMAAWLVAFLGLGVAGMVDFYLWNIDYGHNLSPDAPIRIPDMTYSPPILGSTQLLNIRASSYPSLGTFFLVAAALLAGWAVVRAFRGSGGTDAPTSTATSAHATGRRAGAVVIAALLAVTVLGCGAPDRPDAAAGTGTVPEAVPGDRMAFEAQEDPFCGGPVETVRWGGEIEKVGGERLYFRSAACLAGFLAHGELPSNQIARVRVVDFPQGWKLIDPTHAHFLHTPNLRSPAGPNVLAIETWKMAENLQVAYAGELLDWDGVLALARERWGMSPSPGNDPGGTPLPEGVR